MQSSARLSIVALLLACGLTGCEQKSSPVATNTSANRAASPATNPGNPVNTPVGTAADNTARNSVDRSGDTKTPMDQSEAGADIKITAAIRRAIMDDAAMSINAQNCKIITDKGVVTLRGAVNSQAEKDAIGVKATTVAGATKVNNQLEVTVK